MNDNVAREHIFEWHISKKKSPAMHFIYETESKNIRTGEQIVLKWIAGEVFSD